MRCITLAALLWAALAQNAPGDVFYYDNGAGLTFGINSENGTFSSVALQGSEFYQLGDYVADYGFQLGIDDSSFKVNTTNGDEGFPAEATDEGAFARVTGSYAFKTSAIEFVRTYEFVTGLNVIRTTTTITNVGEETVEQLRLFDTFDPDQGAVAPTGDSSTNTTNDVFDLVAFRVAQATNGYSVVLGQTDPVGFTAGSLGIFNTADLNAHFASPFDPEGAYEDIGFAIAFELTLGSDESITVSYDQAFGETSASARANFLAAQESAPVPEPATLAIWTGVGLVGLVGAARRRFRKVA